jgi:hypothetical protein
VGVALFFSAVILVDLRSGAKVAFFLLFVASGAAFYAVRARQLRASGQDPALQIREQADWGAP